MKGNGFDEDYDNDTGPLDPLQNILEKKEQYEQDLHDPETLRHAIAVYPIPTEDDPHLFTHGILIQHTPQMVEEVQALMSEELNLKNTAIIPHPDGILITIRQDELHRKEPEIYQQTLHDYRDNVIIEANIDVDSIVTQSYMGDTIEPIDDGMESTTSHPQELERIEMKKLTRAHHREKASKGMIEEVGRMVEKHHAVEGIKEIQNDMNAKLERIDDAFEKPHPQLPEYGGNFEQDMMENAKQNAELHEGAKHAGMQGYRSHTIDTTQLPSQHTLDALDEILQGLHDEVSGKTRTIHALEDIIEDMDHDIAKQDARRGPHDIEYGTVDMPKPQRAEYHSPQLDLLDDIIEKTSQELGLKPHQKVSDDIEISPKALDPDFSKTIKKDFEELIEYIDGEITGKNKTIQALENVTQQIHKKAEHSQQQVQHASEKPEKIQRKKSSYKAIKKNAHNFKRKASEALEEGVFKKKEKETTPHDIMKEHERAMKGGFIKRSFSAIGALFKSSKDDMQINQESHAPPESNNHEVKTSKSTSKKLKRAAKELRNTVTHAREGEIEDHAPPKKRNKTIEY